MMVGMIVRGLLDIGCLCFGLDALAWVYNLRVPRKTHGAEPAIMNSSVAVVGCICFGLAGLIDFFRPW